VVEAVLTRVLIQKSLYESAARVYSEVKAASAGKSEAEAIEVLPQSVRKKRHFKVFPAGGKIASPVCKIAKNINYLVEHGTLR
jgi:hypothetical protein